MHGYVWNINGSLDHQTILARNVFEGVPAVKSLVKEAESILRALTPNRDPSFDAYVSGDSAQVDAQVRALYVQLRKRRLTYRVEPPESQPPYQKVRSVNEVLRDGHGCCIDLVLFLASCLRQVGIHPLIVVIGDARGPYHAILGYWLYERELNRNLQSVIDSGTFTANQSDMHFVEVTDVLGNRHVFKKAQRDAESHLSSAEVCYAVDVEDCRRLGIEPLGNVTCFHRDDYVSRSGLEKEVLDALFPPNGTASRLVTLHGYGGMGKTQTAIRCGEQAMGMFKDGVFLVNLEGSPQSKESIAEAIGRELGIPPENSTSNEILTALHDKEMLLILDNYESVDCPDVQGYVALLLNEARLVRLLVTGREAVKLDVERRIPVEGMVDEEAAQLFIARAQLKKPGWQPTREGEAPAEPIGSTGVSPSRAPDEHSHLTRILDLTERIPLAIELAAAWTDEMSLKEIADDIEATPLGETSSLQPDTARADQIERHASLTRCLDWSFRRLQVWAQDGFAQLGVFADSFSVETVAAVSEASASDARRLLYCLHQAALLNRFEVGGGSRYTLLRPTRAYAAEKLEAYPSACSIRQRFVAYFCQQAKAKGELTKPGAASPAEMAKALDWIETEWRNLLECADIAFAAGDWAMVGDLSDAVREFYDVRGYWIDCESLYERALTARRSASDRVGEGTTLMNLGHLYERQGRCSEAELAYQQSLTIRREVGDRLGEGQTLNNLGTIYRYQSRWTEAELAYQQSLAIAREVGDRRSEGRSLRGLGNLYRDQGWWTEAEADYQQSLTIAREVGDRRGEGQTLNNLGYVYCKQKRWAEAEAAYQQGLAIRRELRDRISEGKTLRDYVKVLAAQGDMGKALELGRQAVAVLETTEDTRTLAEVRELVAKWEQEMEGGR